MEAKKLILDPSNFLSRACLENLHLAEGQCLIGIDLGGTRARAMGGWMRDGMLHLEPLGEVKVADANSATELIAMLEEKCGTSFADAAHICVAAAGGYENGVVVHSLTTVYYNGRFEILAALKAVGVNSDDVTVVNDIKAPAMSLLAPEIADKATTILKGSSTGGPIILFVPGTGLGTFIMYPLKGGGWFFNPAEGGNVPVPVSNPFLTPVLTWLGEKLKRAVKLEELISGRGWVKCAMYIQAAMLHGWDELRGMGIEPKDNEALMELDLEQKGVARKLDELVAAGRLPGLVRLFGMFFGAALRSLVLNIWGEPGKYPTIYVGGTVGDAYLRNAPNLLDLEAAFRHPGKFFGIEDCDFHDLACATVALRKVDGEPGGPGAVMLALEAYLESLLE